jgi:hypothetical protein
MSYTMKPSVARPALRSTNFCATSFIPSGVAPSSGGVRPVGRGEERAGERRFN